VSVFDPHELTHAYASLLGDPPLFFKEGLAETIGCGLWDDDDWITPPDNVASLMVTSEFRKLTGDAFFGVYGAAAGFTRFLIDHYGRDAYLGFYAHAHDDASADQIATVFATSFGQPLDAAIHAWLAGPRQSREDICMHLTECATPVLGDAGGTEMAALACGPAVVPSTLANPLAVVRHLPVAQTTAITLRASGVRPMLLRVRGCSKELRPSLGSFTAQPGGQSEVWTRLPAGDYWVLGYMPLAANNSFSATDGAVSVDLLGPPAESACSAAPIRRISPATTQVTLRGSFSDTTERDQIDGAPDFAVAFQLDQQRLLATDTYLHDGTPYDGSRVTLCQQGCPENTPQSCMAGTLGASSTLPFAGEQLVPGTSYTLVLAGSSSDLGYQLGLRFLR
jgi:hypothetical protein